MKVHKSKDFFAGLIFIFFGVSAVFIASSYRMGTAVRMGPGYFPTMLGCVLTILGLIITVRALWLNGDMIKLETLRPLFLIPAAVLAFSFLVQPLGLVLACLALVVIGSLGGWEFRLREVAILCFVLTLLIVVVFVFGLKLPLKVWPI